MLVYRLILKYLLYFCCIFYGVEVYGIKIKEVICMCFNFNINFYVLFFKFCCYVLELVYFWFSFFMSID